MTYFNKKPSDGFPTKKNKVHIKYSDSNISNNLEYFNEISEDSDIVERINNGELKLPNINEEDIDIIESRNMYEDDRNIYPKKSDEENLNIYSDIIGSSNKYEGDLNIYSEGSGITDSSNQDEDNSNSYSEGSNSYSEGSDIAEQIDYEDMALRLRLVYDEDGDSYLEESDNNSEMLDMAIKEAEEMHDMVGEFINEAQKKYDNNDNNDSNLSVCELENKLCLPPIDNLSPTEVLNNGKKWKISKDIITVRTCDTWYEAIETLRSLKDIYVGYRINDFIISEITDNEICQT